MKNVQNTSNETSTLCAIVHGLYEPWIEILNKGQELTWLQGARRKDITIIHAHGIPVNRLGQILDRLHEKLRWQNRGVALMLRVFDILLTYPWIIFNSTYQTSKRLYASHPAIQVNFPDIYLTLRWKNLAVMRYFLNETDCDYLFMTTTSSYINLVRLAKVVRNLPKTSLYAGAIAYQGANFAAGNNRLMSRDVVQLFLENSNLWDPTVIEDLALGNLAARLGLELVPLPQLNISSIDQLSETSSNELNSHFHIRVKSGPLFERNDILVMQEIHRRIIGEGHGELQNGK